MSKRNTSIALVGNPNAGKSTLFNELTGMRQHTGNWTGKTVSCAKGTFKYKGKQYDITDLPGTYSLSVRSEEEAVTRDYILQGEYDLVLIVCDGTCLERSLLLVLQILELRKEVIVCINFEDELKKKGVQIDTAVLSKSLGVPVCTVSARHNSGITKLLDCLNDRVPCAETKRALYPQVIETAVRDLSEKIKPIIGSYDANWAALKLIEGEQLPLCATKQETEKLKRLTSETLYALSKNGWDIERISSSISRALTLTASEIHFNAVKMKDPLYTESDRKLDKIFTGRFTAYPVMLLALAVLFWLTIFVANYPSAWLAALFSRAGIWLEKFLVFIGTAKIVRSILLDGAYKILSCVVSVMLPPMAIFFPLFTLLEDLGYLPRAAYNMDKAFSRCGSCGKQALTMCMSLGCTAVGITGCRIIDSPREKLMSALTCSFIPCNGKFPALIALIGIFLSISGFNNSPITVAVILAAAAAFSVAAAMSVTNLLSKTVLKGSSSPFILELPPYRRPQPGKILIRSLFDRTFVTLLRAVKIAVPAGVIIWLLSNIQVNGASVLQLAANFLDPAADIFGLDGMVMLAFILGIPANEIVLPIAMMGYMSAGTVTADISLKTMISVFVSNGWNTRICICTLLFMLFHWPCSTALLTFHKETANVKWTAFAALLPSAAGLLICAAVSALFKIFA